MQAPLEQQDDRQPDEREIRSLSDQSGVAPAQVRTLFRREHARLGMGAKVHSYLAVLTASNVRGMLRRVAQRREAALELRNGAQAPRELSNDSRDSEPGAEDDRPSRDLRRQPADTTQDVQGWEDDGGRVREAR
jgi:hypothetical protein